MLVAAPLAVHVPLAALAGILLYVAWNMGEWHEFARLGRFALTYRTILLATFFLTVIIDLTVAMQVGVVLACAFFIYRMNTLSRVETLPAPAADVELHRLVGVHFFGSINKLERLLDPLRFHGPTPPRAVVLDCSQLLALDTTAVDALDGLRRNVARRGGTLFVSGAERPVTVAAAAFGIPRTRRRGAARRGHDGGIGGGGRCRRPGRRSECRRVNGDGAEPVVLHIRFRSTRPRECDDVARWRRRSTGSRACARGGAVRQRRARIGVAGVSRACSVSMPCESRSRPHWRRARPMTR